MFQQIQFKPTQFRVSDLSKTLNDLNVLGRFFAQRRAKANGYRHQRCPKCPAAMFGKVEDFPIQCFSCGATVDL